MSNWDKNKVKELVKELEFLVDKKNICFAFISGSVFENYGNCESDLDIYVICYKLDKAEIKKNLKDSNEIISVKNNHILHWYKKNNLKYDVEYYEKEELEKAIHLLNNIKIRKSGKIEPLDDSIFELLHRFKTSYPIFKEDTYRYLYNISNFDNLSIQLAVLKEHKYVGIIEDIKGAMADGDYGTAYCALRNLAEMIFMAYLACFNFTNPNTKWLYRKITNYEDKEKDFDLLKNYKKIISLTFSENQTVSQVESVINICEKYHGYVKKWINYRKCD